MPEADVGSGPTPQGRRAMLGAGLAGVVAGVLGTWAVEAEARSGRATPPATPPAQNGIQGLFNLRDMGAAGDGTTDDTEAVTQALARVMQSGTPLYIPPGTYVVRKPLVTDVSQIRGIGARIFGAGQSSVIDLTAVTSGTAWSVVNTNPSPGAFYIYIEGLNVQGNTDGPVLAVGQPSFEDAINSSALRDVRVGNGGSGSALQLNYVLATDISGVYDSAGALGIELRQVQFSRLRVAPSGARGTCLALRDGYVLSNVIQCPDLEVGEVGLEISSQAARSNGFICPYFNCPTAIDATGGDTNAIFVPMFAGRVQTQYHHNVGIVQFP